MVRPIPHRSSSAPLHPPFLFLALVLICSALAAPSFAGAEWSKIPDALQLVAEPNAGLHVVSPLEVGETFVAYLIVDSLRADRLAFAQIGMEHSDDLTPLSTSAHPDASIVLRPTASDIEIGFVTPLFRADGPHTLVRWTFMRTAPPVAGQPSFVRLTDFHNGEPSRYRGLPSSHHLSNFADAGGIFVAPLQSVLIRFAASAQYVPEDRTYFVEWEYIGAELPRLDGEVVGRTGRREFTATAHRVHQLEIPTATETIVRTVEVNLIREPLVRRFEARTQDPLQPQNIWLEWECEGAEIFYLDSYPLPVSPWGRAFVEANQPLNILLRAENEWGASFQTLVLRGDGEPVIGLFQATSTQIDLGERTRLEWSVAHANTVTIEPGLGEVPNNGTLEIEPTETTQYTLTASTATGSVSATVGVTVWPLRILQFTPHFVNEVAGLPVTLRWDVLNAEEAWIEPDVGPVTLPTGSVEVTPQIVDATYTLTARRGSVHESRTSRIVLTVPDIVTYFITPRTPAPEITFHTYVRGADSLRIDPQIGWLPLTEGVLETPASGAVRGPYVLTAWNLAGVVQRQFPYPRELPSSQWSGPGPVSLRTGQRVAPQFVNLYTAQSKVFLMPDEVVLAEGDRDISFEVWADSTMQFRVMAYTVLDTTFTDFTLNPLPERPLTLTADDAILERGESTFLRWAIEGSGYDLTLYPMGIGPYSSVDSLEVSPRQTMVYEAIATRWGSQSYDFHALTTVVVSSQGVSLSAQPARPVVGSTCSLELVIPEGATAATLEPGFGSIPPISQSIPFAVTGAVNFTLSVTTPEGDFEAFYALHPYLPDDWTVPTLVEALDLNVQRVSGGVEVEWSAHITGSVDHLTLHRAIDGQPAELFLDSSDIKGSARDDIGEAWDEVEYELSVWLDEQVLASRSVGVASSERLRTRLLANVPNPFNPQTEIRFEIAKAGHHRLEIFTASGRRVRTVEWELPLGPGAWTWDGTGDDAERLASGVYFVRLIGERVTPARRVVLVK